MNGHVYRLPVGSSLSERDRIEGGIAPPNSERALAICRAFAARQARAKTANRANFGSDLPRLTPDGETVAFEPVKETMP